MKISYTTKMARYVTDDIYRKSKLGKSAGIFELGPTLNGRCHLLVGNKKGNYSVDLKHPFRMLFTPDSPVKREGTKDDLRLVRSICIIAIKDTHR